MKQQNNKISGLILMLCMALTPSLNAAGSSQVPDRDFYATLGIRTNATKREITQAYHKLALKWHPDRPHSGIDDEDQKATFKAINTANKVLSDSETRTRYNTWLETNREIAFETWLEAQSEESDESTDIEEIEVTIPNPRTIQVVTPKEPSIGEKAKIAGATVIAQEWKARFAAEAASQPKSRVKTARSEPQPTNLVYGETVTYTLNNQTHILVDDANGAIYFPGTILKRGRKIAATPYEHNTIPGEITPVLLTDGDIYTIFYRMLNAGIFYQTIGEKLQVYVGADSSYVDDKENKSVKRVLQQLDQALKGMHRTIVPRPGALLAIETLYEIDNAAEAICEGQETSLDQSNAALRNALILRVTQHKKVLGWQIRAAKEVGNQGHTAEELQTQLDRLNDYLTDRPSRRPAKRARLETTKEEAACYICFHSVESPYAMDCNCTVKEAACKTCLEDWVKTSHTCPICRKANAKLVPLKQ